MRIKYLNTYEESFQGKATFHEKEYIIKIQKHKNEKTIKVPFAVIGVTDNEILVRVSGPSGVYIQDYAKFKENTSIIEIDSDVIFSDILNHQNKFDTLEIFVK